MAVTGIYKITSPSGRIYIGQSINIEKRFKRYENAKCYKQKRLYNSFIKYGVNNHSFEIILKCSIEDLNNKERYYQDLYDVTNKSGLNITLTKSNDKKGCLPFVQNIIRFLLRSLVVDLVDDYQRDPKAH